MTNFYPSTGKVVFTEINGTAGHGQTDPRTITNGINNPNIHYLYMNP